MDGENKKILIVEDDKDFLWLLRQNFMNEPFTVSYALDGEQALKIAEKEKPDLILLDILLPKLDGMEVAGKLKEKGNTAKIIFLTNLRDSENISRAMETVEDLDYIVKSDSHIDEIISRIKTKLGI